MKSVSAFLIVFLVVSFIFTFVSPAAQYDPEVYRVQKALRVRGYDPGPLDGQWGRSTRNAVEQFQRDSGLPITGMLDQQTKTKLGIVSSERAIKHKKETKERRLALVIGNGDYKQVPLRNPVNDANDMSEALRGLGFEVEKRTNASQEEMEDAIFSFSQRLKKGGVGLFYFSGHGAQVRGRNYLIPVGATIRAEREVKYKAIDAGLVTDGMYDAGNGLNIVLLDACRDNPFSRSFRSSSRGLARMDASTGTFIAYATAPGAFAVDGTGRNGIFTKHLLKYLKEPGLKIEDVLKRVRKGVMQETGSKQVPWQASSLTGDFYFASSGAVIEEPAEDPKKSFLSVESNIKGAKVYLDGRRVGITPSSDISISTGRHIVLVEKPGYEPYQKRVDVEPGRSASLYIHLSPVKMKTGRLYVDAKPADARVRILNIVPKFYQGIELEAGRYHVEVSAGGYQAKDMWVSVREGEDKNVVIRLEPVAAETRPGETWRDPVTGMEFVWVPGGCYQMGCGNWAGNCYDDDKPVHEVCVGGFWMGKYEVTQGEWKRVMVTNPSRFEKGDNYPVEGVSWNDAIAFIEKLNLKNQAKPAALPPGQGFVLVKDPKNPHGPRLIKPIKGDWQDYALQARRYKFRLPTEAEWEYACRSGGKLEKYAGGSQVERVAWYGEDAVKGTTHPVGTKEANGLDIYDMSGNIWEWCEDIYARDAYGKHQRDNPIYMGGGSYRVLRGGGWLGPPRFVRCANRFRLPPDLPYGYVGFRLLRTK